MSEVTNDDVADALMDELFGGENPLANDIGPIEQPHGSCVWVYPAGDVTREDVREGVRRVMDDLGIDWGMSNLHEGPIEVELYD